MIIVNYVYWNCNNKNGIYLFYLIGLFIDDIIINNNNNNNEKYVKGIL